MIRFEGFPHLKQSGTLGVRYEYHLRETDICYDPFMTWCRVESDPNSKLQKLCTQVNILLGGDELVTGLEGVIRRFIRTICFLAPVYNADLLSVASSSCFH